VLATLHERYGTAAVIMSAIVPRKAACKYGYAHWDGVSEPVSGGGSAFFNSSVFNPEINYTAQLEVNSLKLRFLDGTRQAAAAAAAVAAGLPELAQQSNKRD
jgi:hypothetical protein